MAAPASAAQGSMLEPSLDLAAAASAARGAPNASLVQLEDTLETTVDLLRQGVIILEDFKAENQETLWNRINQIIANFQTASQLKQQADEIEVPADIFRYLDEGKNPDLFTEEIIQTCKTRNEQSYGRLSALSTLREALAEELRSSWPQDQALVQHTAWPAAAGASEPAAAAPR